MRSFVLLLAMLFTSTAQAETKLLVFSAQWCGPCRSMSPTIAKLESEGVKVVRVDIDKYPSYSRSWNVRSVPTFVVVDGDVERSRVVGSQRIETLRGMVK